MRNIDKKRLKEIIEKLSDVHELLEQLCDDHQEWMDEREDNNENWPDTPTGERASDDQYNFEDWRDTLDSMLSEIEEQA